MRIRFVVEDAAGNPLMACASPLAAVAEMHRNRRAARVVRSEDSEVIASVDTWRRAPWAVS